jgi:hypothetical protein
VKGKAQGNPEPLHQTYTFSLLQCNLCADDLECLHAETSGRDCFIPLYLDPSNVGLLNTETKELNLIYFWANDANNCGDLCDFCECHAGTIDCHHGRDLAIIPKTFSQTWTPQKLDLRDNTRLVLLGSGSLAPLGDTLEEVWLPKNMCHI